MTPIQQLMLGTGTSKKTYMDDVFSTYLFRGNATSRSITNGIDLAGEGGMTWIKNRDATSGQDIFDTVRGTGKRVTAESDAAQSNAGNCVNAFNSNGFGLGTDSMTNTNNEDYASWTFRKAPGFFDVVTYTGSSSARTISHNLGCVPGSIFIKKTSGNDSWAIYHQGTDSTSPEDYYLKLDATSARIDDATFWNDTKPTASVFSLGGAGAVNSDGHTYVAYLFAGGESTEATAKCVDFDGNDSLTLASSTDFTLDGDFTVEGWFYVDAHTAYDSIWGLGKYSGASPNDGIEFYYASDGVLTLYAMGAVKITGPVLKIQTWQHIALVRSGSKVTLYVDGYDEGHYTESSTYGSNGNNTFVIGGALNASSAVVDHFDGKISNFRVVKGTAVYTSSFRPPTKPLTNITNTKLLCCNNSSNTGSTVTPGTITANDNPSTTRFPHSPFDDPAAFKFGDSKEGIIKCGSYVGNGSTTGPKIHLGWEPQWLMIKITNTVDDWLIFDDMRGIGGTSMSDVMLRANTTGADDAYGNAVYINASGFQPRDNDAMINHTNQEYNYIAIRRPDGYVGKPVEDATKVFAMVYGNGSATIPSYVSPFKVEYGLEKYHTQVQAWWSSSRLTGKTYLFPNANTAESNSTTYAWDHNLGYIAGTWANSGSLAYMFKRHAGLDVVTYDGTSESFLDIPHNLNAVPEMIWLKCRTEAEDWKVYHVGLNGGSSPEDYYLPLNDRTAQADSANVWYDTAPTSTHFTVGTDGSVNDNGRKYVATLFSSVPGVSKCGYYTGNDSSRTITTGFQPRFLIIRNIDSADEWYTLDTKRGWGSGNDKMHKINDTAASTDTHDFGAPVSTGFTLPDNNPGYNNSSYKYIYYAHA